MARTPFAYAFAPGENLEHGFRRVLAEMSLAARQLGHSRGDLDRSVHHARLLIKRLRALLGLARPALRPSVFKRAKAQLRQAAGLLAAQRDLAATQLILSKLAQKAGRTGDRAVLARTSRALGGSARARASKKKTLRISLQDAMNLVRVSMVEIEKSPARRKSWPKPSTRLDCAFHEMRKAGRKALKHGKDVAFHEWRKKAKRLLYQLELTQAEPDRRQARLRKSVDALQNALGDYHDCVVTETRLGQQFSRQSAAKRILVLLKKRKLRLRKKARKIFRIL